MAISHQEVYGNLATMLGAGLDVKKALPMSVNTGDGPVRDAVIAVTKAIGRGATLTKAIARHPELFPVSDKSMIEAGEKSGRLPEVFKALSDWYKLKAKLWGTIKSGIIRPLLLIHAGAFIMPIPILVVHQMWGKYLLSVISFLMIFYVPAGLVIGLYRWSGDKQGLRLFIDGVLLKVPLLGKGLRDMALGRYCFGFRMLLVSGVPVTKCARIASDLSGNGVISAMLAGGRESARRGKPVSRGFTSDLPRDFVSIWSVGEKSGRLDEITQKLYQKRIEQGEYYFREFSLWLPRLISAFVAAILIYYILSRASVFTPGV